MSRSLRTALALLALGACSPERLERAVATSPPPDYPAALDPIRLGFLPADTAAFGDRQRDALYLARLLWAHYPDKAGTELDGAFVERSAAFIREAAGLPPGDAFAWQVHLQYYLAALDDGHTHARVVYGTADDPWYDLDLAVPPGTDELVVLAVDSSLDARMLGGTAVGVGGVHAREVLAAADRYHEGENPHRARYLLGRYAHLPRYWRALGLAADDSLTLRVATPDGDTLVGTLRPGVVYDPRVVATDTTVFPFARRQPTAYFTQFLPEFSAAYLQANTLLDWTAMRPEIDDYVAWPLRSAARAAARKRKRAEGAVDFGEVLQRFFARVEADSLRRVVLDLRYNGGGDERLGRQFAYYLATPDSLRGGEVYYRFDDYLAAVVPGDYRRFRAAFAKTHGRTPGPDEWVAIDEQVLREGFWQAIDAPGSPFFLDSTIAKFDGEVYVLIGPQTSSAAALLAAVLQDNDLATVVGSPSGNRPGGPTGASTIELPHTGALVALSYLYVERADASRAHETAVIPDVYAPPTRTSVLRGRDPALEAALGIGRGRLPGG